MPGLHIFSGRSRNLPKQCKPGIQTTHLLRTPGPRGRSQAAICQTPTDAAINSIHVLCARRPRGAHFLVISFRTIAEISTLPTWGHYRYRILWQVTSPSSANLHNRLSIGSNKLPMLLLLLRTSEETCVTNGLPQDLPGAEFIETSFQMTS